MSHPFHPEYKGHPLGWCETCECFSIHHEGCPNSGASCNGMGCQECVPIHEEFLKTKHCVQDYLTPEERSVWEKAMRIKHHMLLSLGRGESSINWEQLRKDGEFSRIEEAMFFSPTETTAPAKQTCQGDC